MTCGAGGTTRDLTLAVVRRLAREQGLEAVPHVTATGFTREGLVALLAEAALGGAENVLALRGDPPRGQDTWTAPEGGVRSSLELTKLAAEAGFCVLAAAYPEPHQDSRGWAADLEHLRAKVDAGVRVLVTQLFFDNDDYRRFIERLRAGGIDVPVLPGIIPVTSVAQVERLAELCGARIPKALRRELELRQDNPRAVAELGVAYATAQAAELLAEGAPACTSTRSTARRPRGRSSRRCAPTARCRPQCGNPKAPRRARRYAVPVRTCAAGIGSTYGARGAMTRRKRGPIRIALRTARLIVCAAVRRRGGRDRRL